MTTFKELNLNNNLIAGLKKQNITEPTKVQSLTINKILDNKDLIVNAQTGSGKTLSYLLPMFEKIDSTKRETQVLILAPTHELVMQITEQAKLLSSNSKLDITAFSLIGEVNIQKQIKNIKAIKPHIVVGTSGRVLDLIKQKKLKAHTIKTIILDEVDSLLSGNNVSVVKDIIKTTLRDRQLLGFSASLNETALDILNNVMKEPEVIKIDEEPINPNINHMYLHGDRRDKFTLLRKAIAATNPKRAIVFVNDEDSIEVITAKLNYHSYKAVGIYGRMTKEDRKNALNSFKIGKSKILVSSDLSARGLDIVDVTHVFNLDFPPGKNEYVHRCGRTARGNRKGDAISIVTNQNLSTIRDYKRNFNIDIKKKDLREGKLVDAAFKQTRKPKDSKESKSVKKDIKNKSNKTKKSNKK